MAKQLHGAYFRVCLGDRSEEIEAEGEDNVSGGLDDNGADSDSHAEPGDRENDPGDGAETERIYIEDPESEVFNLAVIFLFFL